MKKWIVVLFSALLLSACASELVRHSVSEPKVDKPATKYIVSHAVEIRFDSGYERTLKANAELLDIGSISQGRVLKPVNTVFTVEAAHNHEAFLVVSEGRIVGFYLPVEKAFSPLSRPVTLPIQERNL